MQSKILILCLAFLGLATELYGQDQVFYNRDIRPILSENCFQCHGFDANTREAGLRLDTFAGATAELESGEGRAIVPGESASSTLLERVTSEESWAHMPPLSTGKSLTESQVTLLRDWIEQGAAYEEHWSFVTPVRPVLPKVQQTAWPKNWIDLFVLRKIEQAGFAPSAAADKRTLIRRVALDLTGLPPTPAELSAYVGDESELAYAKMVDRYLDSPAYGEHMAKHWLDLARYADSSGYQYDKQRSMWVWRDWVIHAYNQNMPFDQFTLEQLAGDLLPNATDQQVLATGFNRNHPITIEGGVIDEEYRTEYVIDRLNTTATVWMGLTVGCARCHDHKFDPISQQEFYQLSAFFNQVAERGLNGFEPMQQIASPFAEPLDARAVAELEAVTRQLATLQRPLSEPEINQWAAGIAADDLPGWQILNPIRWASSGESTFARQPDKSILVGSANPAKDDYEITFETEAKEITAVRLECLTDPSLPGGGPGRHLNSNFVLSEFELEAISKVDASQRRQIKFKSAVADYSQANYEIAKTIDGQWEKNNGWAVDGPSRKKPATAIFIAETPVGFVGGTVLKFKLRHQADFGTHGIGRPRISVTQDEETRIVDQNLPASVHAAAQLSPQSRSVAQKQLLRETLQGLRATEIAQLKKKGQQLSPAKQYPKTMVMRDLAKPRATHVLERGQYDLKGDTVSPGVPAVLNPMSPQMPRNRLGLASWLMDSQHPLTSRVAVNRYWQRLFGTGLVKSIEDFGTQGEWPSHPDLLDTLAIEFVESGWDVKAMLRVMLNSATYRQSSHVTPAWLERDPENRLLARAARLRLDAEQIRDQALAVSGLITQKVGGPSVFPYQPKGLWLELNNRPGLSSEYVVGTGESLYRRSVYTFWKRTVLSPMLKTMDAPSREFCTVQRSRTNTPLQALLLLQAPQFIEAARHLAVRMVQQGGANPQKGITFGFELATSRVPTAREIEVLVSFYQDRKDWFEKEPQAIRSMLGTEATVSAESVDRAALAAFTAVGRLLLNLDETINRG
ncbi:MAG: PSD1 and planctomycete cytochrome C domain-containing protein [Pirellulaceae bacterium]|nr:PSD1 and planctomycete cytochrome C domain-containing protein [Pirellulaceae bacterium]